MLTSRPKWFVAITTEKGDDPNPLSNVGEFEDYQAAEYRAWETWNVLKVGDFNGYIAVSTLEHQDWVFFPTDQYEFDPDHTFPKE